MRGRGEIDCKGTKGGVLEAAHLEEGLDNTLAQSRHDREATPQEAVDVVLGQCRAHRQRHRSLVQPGEGERWLIRVQVREIAPAEPVLLEGV